MAVSFADKEGAMVRGRMRKIGQRQGKERLALITFDAEAQQTVARRKMK